MIFLKANIKRNRTHGLNGAAAGLLLLGASLLSCSSAFAQPVAVSDDFSGFSLNETLWTFVDPVGDSSFDQAGGVLTLSVPAGTNHDLYTNGNESARIIQPVLNEDLGLEAKFETIPSSAYQIQGVLFEESTANYIRIDIYHDGTVLHLHAAKLVADAYTPLGDATISLSSEGWIRVSRVVDTFTVEWSDNGSLWQTGFSFDYNLDLNNVGVFAGNGGGGNNPAPAFDSVIDYFFDINDPIIPEDGGLIDIWPPIVSDISVVPGPGTGTALVTCTTNESATTLLSFGLDTNYGTDVPGTSGDGISHQFQLTGLAPDQTYHFVIQATDGLNNTGTTADQQFVNGDFSPVITVWGGLNQRVGHLGPAQTDFNLVGNVFRWENLSTLGYSLNGAPEEPLNWGDEPDGFGDHRRLANNGDFNVDLPVSQLIMGPNTIAVHAVDIYGNEDTATATVTRETGSSPLPYAIDWEAVSVPQDVGQIVDGDWNHGTPGIRTISTGYDRLFLIGEDSWLDYEIECPITIHEVQEPGPLSANAGLGFIMRFTGHVIDPPRFPYAQPKWGYQPFGGLGWVRWNSGISNPPTVQFYHGDDDDYQNFGGAKAFGPGLDPDTFTEEVSFSNTALAQDFGLAEKVRVGETFMMKMRCRTLPDAPNGDGVTRYSFKVWLDTETEPVDWNFEVDQQSEAALRQGGICLLAHHVDATFGDLTITDISGPLPPAAQDDVLYVYEGGSGEVDVLANDSDIGGALVPGTVAVADFPFNGTITNIDPATGAITYLHDGGLAVADSFTYNVEDNDGMVSNLAMVRVNIGPVPPENFISDDFNSCGLDPLWTFIDPQGDAPVPVIVGAFTGDAQVALSVPGGSNHEPYNNYLGAPYILQAAQDQDFTLEVKFSSTLPDSFAALQGVLVKQDDSSWLRFDFYSDGSGNIRLFATPPPASSWEFNGQVANPGDSPLYMRIGRTGDTWDLDYSLDGSFWADATTFSYSMTVTGVGLFAGNSGGASAPAFTTFVDYFSNMVDPITEPDDQEQNSLFVTVSGDGSVTKNPDQAVYGCGDPVQLTANADPDWVFTGWSGDLEGTDNPASITMDRPRFVTANFAPTTGTVIAANTSGVAGISTVIPCATAIPVEILRDSSVDIHGFTVTVALTNLDPCDGLSSFSEGDFLSGAGATTFQVIDNQDGSFDIDATINGEPCGATALTGTLFTLDVTNAIGDGTGTIDVTAVELRDCSNAPLAASAGEPAGIVIDTTPPAGVTGLASDIVSTGNPAGNVIAVDLDWIPSVDPDVTSVAVYRKGFGSYPEYDDGGGSAPNLPVDPLGEGWTLVATVPVGSNTATDLAPTRDYWYFCAQAVDALGNPSTTLMTGGVLNYLPGDVSDGGQPLQDGDNQVWTEDLTLLGAHYGTQDGDALYLNTLDIGPSSDMNVDGLPTTDDIIGFEDLMLFGINFAADVGGSPLVLSFDNVPEPAPSNTMALHLPDLPGIGQTFQAELVMAGDGQIQGLTIPLGWDAGVVAPIAVQGGPLLTAQGGSSLTLSASPGVVDICLAGVRDRGVSGVGTVAEVTFQVLADGNPQIQLMEIEARGQANNPVPVTITAASAVGENRSLPTVSALHPNYPNPFNPMTTIAFDLAVPGRVRVDIFSIDGRRIRTLINDNLTAGRHAEAWDGKDKSGRSVASGTYLFTLVGPEIKQSRRMLLVK